MNAVKTTMKTAAGFVDDLGSRGKPCQLSLVHWTAGEFVFAGRRVSYDAERFEVAFSDRADGGPAAHRCFGGDAAAALAYFSSLAA